MEKLIKKRKTFLNKLENEINKYEELESYVKSIDFGDDLYGRNKYGKDFYKIKENIKRFRVILDKVEEKIRTKDYKRPICHYCDDYIDSDVRHMKYYNGQFREFCSKGCMKMVKAEIFRKN
jgi:hypothetical protein